MARNVLVAYAWVRDDSQAGMSAQGSSGKAEECNRLPSVCVHDTQYAGSVPCTDLSAGLDQELDLQDADTHTAVGLCVMLA